MQAPIEAVACSTQVTEPRPNLEDASRAANREKPIGALTSLRFACALLVFLFHVEIRMPHMPEWLHPVIVNGYTGMSFFFILSGFVLTVRYLNEPINFRRFIVARLARIYPAFIAAFVLSFPPVLAAPIKVVLLSTTANLILVQAWFPNLFMIGINGGTWSLSVEMFFYLLFPLLLVALRSSKSLAVAPFLIVLALWIVSFTPGLVDLVYPANDAWRFYYSAPPYRMAEFALGIAVAVAWKRGIVAPQLWWVGLSGIAFVAGCFVFDGMQGQNLAFLNIVAVPFFACLIVYAAHRRPRPLEWRIPVYLGEISYGIYIFQFVFLQYVFPALHHAGLGPMAITLIGLTITVAVASFSFHWFETPIRAWVTREAPMTVVTRFLPRMAFLRNAPDIGRSVTPGTGDSDVVSSLE